MNKSRWVSELHWRRTGQQTRSKRTQAALLDAAELLILEKGTEATSIADIANRAGYSVGSVYHHFKDKRALYFALFHRMTDAYEAINREASNPARWHNASIRDLFRGYLEIALAAAVETGAAKAAVSAVISDYPELGFHYAEIEAETRRAMLALVLERPEEIGRSEPEIAAAFAIDQLSAMVRGRIDPTRQAAIVGKLDDDAFIDYTLEMISAFLRLKPLS